MNKQSLIDIFNRARETNAEYIFVAIKLPGLEIPEMIVNARENFNFKENYYINTYDDNLVHRHNSEIEIVGLSCGKLKELENIY